MFWPRREGAIWQSGNPGNVILQIRARLLQGMHNNYIVIIINHSHKQESDHICTVVLCIAAVITSAALSMVVKESLRIVVGKNVRYLFLFALMESYIKCMASHVNNDPLYVTNKSMFLIFDKLEVIHFKVQKPRSHDVMPSVVLKNEIGTFLCNFLFGFTTLLLY